jgi:asparagine synthase (glutamine-hydrolysing)
MTDEIRHRGPDSEGCHLAAGIGIGFRRLAIIDLERGDQPIANDDASVVAAVNGEIYNAPELREDLAKNGHRFRSRSEAEVVVHLYEERGLEMVHALRGMFAIALWDHPRRRLVLVRDRLGIKPLVWAQVEEGLLFASEAKSILATGMVSAALDTNALGDLFTFGFVTSPRTIFDGIRRLPPGHLLLFEHGTPSVRRYWQVDFPAPGTAPRRTARQWQDGLLERLEESVRLHLRSDVPVGTWLSPGLDSSTVAAIARRAGADPLLAFTLAFDDPEADERRHHATLSDFPEYGIEGRDVTCRITDFERYPLALWHAEDPSTGGLEIPRMVLSEETSRAVKVVVTGEGADEVFGGYSWYTGERLLAPLGRLPRPLRGFIASRRRVEARWPGGSRVLSGPSDLNAQRFARLINSPATDLELAELLTDELQQRAGDSQDHTVARDLPESGRSWLRFQKLQYFDLTLRLPDVILHRVDRASMAHAVEVRLPFLDHPLVEYCATIPPSLKLRWRREKEILRRAVTGLLPREIVTRRKRGLRAPVAGWFRSPLPEFALHLLSESSLRAKGYFDPGAVTSLRRAAGAGSPRAPRLLLGVLAIQTWDEIFRRGWRPGRQIRGALAAP